MNSVSCEDEKKNNQIKSQQKRYIHFTHKCRINAIKQGYCGQFKTYKKNKTIQTDMTQMNLNKNGYKFK